MIFSIQREQELISSEYNVALKLIEELRELKSDHPYLKFKEDFDRLYQDSISDSIEDTKLFTIHSVIMNGRILLSIAIATLKEEYDKEYLQRKYEEIAIRAEIVSSGLELIKTQRT